MAPRTTRWIERIGLLAVIVSLGLLVAELRQTNAAIRGAAYQDLADGYRDVMILLADDPARMEVLRRWWSEPTGDTLTTQESLQVHAILMAIFRNHESTHRQLSVGLIEEDEAVAFFGDRFIGSDAFLVWWGDNKRRYSTDFVQFLEETILPRHSGS